MRTKKLMDITLSGFIMFCAQDHGPAHDNCEDDDQGARGYDAVAEL